MNARCGLRAIESENPSSVITFEYHYGDGFENDFTVQRTEWYHVISHPYVFFDGMDPVIGAPNCLASTGLYRTRYAERMAETGGVSPIDIQGQFAQIGDEWVVMADYTRVDDVPLEDLQATLLLYEDDIYFCCGPGGNSIWDGVVRSLYDEPISLAAVGAPVRVSTAFALDPTWNREKLRIVAYVQNSITREIYQGHRVTAPATAVGDPVQLTSNSTLFVMPNPARGPVTIVVDLSRERERGPVRLDLLDVSGRQVEGLAGKLQPLARNLISWDGNGQAPGVYFVRLASPSGVRVQRLVRVE